MATKAPKVIKATVPADLLLKIGKAEKMPRGPFESKLHYQRRILALYDVKLDRHHIVATRKEAIDG